MRIRYLSNCVSEPSILELWKIREKEKSDDMRMLAALHGVQLKDEDKTEEAKDADKNAMNKKAAMQLMAFGGRI